MTDKTKEESLLHEVANAIMAAQVTQAREKVSERTLPLSRIEAAFDVAIAEADRSSSILLFALAEDLMLDCIKSNMNSRVKGVWERATGANGLLATASNRIDLLELLFWIRSQTAADLRLMKSIRNRFAHHADVHSLEEKTVVGWVSSMSNYEKILDRASVEKREKYSIRELYLMRSLATLTNLAGELVIGPIASREGVAPNSILVGGFDNLPENLQDANRTQARMLLCIHAKKGKLADI